MSNIQDIRPLSSMQQGMLYSTIISDTRDYCVEHAFEMRGQLNFEVLEKTVRNLADRHDALRTVIRHEGIQKPVHVVTKKLEPPLSFHAVPEGDWGAFITTWKQQNRKKGIDLSKPLWHLDVLHQDDKFCLVWLYHHMILDGWSFAIILEEFFSLYSNSIRGEVAKLPVRGSVTGYLKWLQAQQTDSDRYWHHYLERYQQRSPILPFIAGEKVTAFGDLQYLTCKLTTDISGKIDTMSRQNKFTANIFFQGMWGVLLSKYNDVGDVVFGTTVSGRAPEFQGVDDLVGMFINTIPVRIRYDRETSVLAMLKQLQNAFLDGHRHQHYPLNDIFRSTDLKENLFDHVTIFENYPVNSSVLTMLPEELKVVGQDVYTKTDLPLTVEFNKGDSGGYSVIFGFDSNRVNPEFVQRLSAHLANLVVHVLDNPEIKIANTTCFSESDTRRLIDQSDSIKIPNHSLIELFERQVRQTPDNVAIVTEQYQWTYAQLNDKVNRLAIDLTHTYHVAEGDLVAVLMGRGVGMITSILAILKCGAAYVPLNPEFPQYRLKFICEDANVRTLLTESHFVIQDLPVQHVVLTYDFFDTVGHQEYHVPKIRPNDLAYVMYTSGSTGNPKGVMIEHAGVVNMAVSQIEKFGISSEDCVLQFAPFTFDAVVSEIFTAFFAGARLALIDQDKINDPTDFVAFCRSKAVTVVTLPPSFLANFEPREFESMRILISAGEPLKADVARKWADAVTLFNAYGPTEFSVCATIHHVSAPIHYIPIGCAIANTLVQLKDHTGNYVADGMEGELHLAGAGLARGYLNNPELTHQAFIVDQLTGRRSFKTGDKAIRTPDGYLFKGRNDRQLKVRGFRIDPAEIEHQLMQYSGVQNVALLLDTRLESQLLAFVAAESGFGISDLKNFLSTRMPHYMIPNRIILVTELPLTAHGKVDEKTLLSWADMEHRAKVDAARPLSAVEQSMSDIWMETLNLPLIHPDDNYYQLGGDSILAIRLISRLRKANMNVTLKDLKQFPTISALAQKVGNKKLTDRENDHGVVGLTPIQHWYFEKVGTNAPHRHFTYAVVVRLEQRLTLDILTTAMRTLVRQHEALSYKYSLEAEVIQVSEENQLPNISAAEVSLTDNKTWSELLDYATAQIDLPSGDLLGALLVKGTEADHLLLVAHHLVMDNISMRIFLDQLEALTTELKSGRPGIRFHRSDSFRKWSSTVLAYANTDACLGQLPIWRDICSKARTQMIFDKPGVAPAFQTKSIRFNADFTDRWIAHTRNENSETNAIVTLLAALALTVQNVFQKSEFSVQVEGHGRDELNGVDVTNTIGWFTTIYPLLLTADIRSDVRKTLTEVKRSLQSASLNPISYGLLKYLTDRSLVQMADLEAASQINFNYDGTQGRERASAWTLMENEAQNDNLHIDQDVVLYVNTAVLDGELVLTVDYNSSVVEQEKITRFLGDYQFYLEQTIEQRDEHGRQSAPGAEIAQGSFEAEQHWPLTPTQEGLLYEHLRDESSRYYHCQSVTLITGALNVNAFLHSLNALVRKHDVFRTSFRMDPSGNPIQVVSPKPEIVIHFKKKAGDAADPLKEFEEQDAATHFNVLSGEPLIRVSLLERDENTHYLFWSFHHIVMDALSMVVLEKDLFENYETMLTGGVVNNARVPSYRTFVDWVYSQNKQDAAAFWKTYLAAYHSPAIENREDPSAYFDPATRKGYLPENEWQHLKALAKRESTSIYTVIEALWCACLMKFNHVTDVVVGKILTGRPDELNGVEDIVGLFINTIPLRATLSKHTTFKDLVHDLFSHQDAARQYQYLSLADIQALSSNGQPLFDHVIEFERPVQGQSNWQQFGLKFEVAAGRDFVHYGFSIVFSVSDQVSYTLKYDRTRFPETKMTHLRQCLHQTTTLLTNAPDRPVLDVIQEQQGWWLRPNEPVPLPSQMPIQQFEHQARVRPSQTAVTHRENTLTYAELNERSESVAHLIRMKGVPPGSLIPLVSNRDIQWLAAILGILKCRCGYIPIDPGFPLNRVHQILDDVNPQLILLGQGFEKMKSIPEEWISLGFDLDGLAGRPQPETITQILPDDIAYVIYTSGSTGQPKGAMIEQRGMLNHLCSKISLCHLNHDSVVAQNAPQTFDISIWQLMAPLMTGGRVVILDQQHVAEPLDFVRMITDEKIDVLEVVPSYLSIILEILDEEGIQAWRRQLRFLIITGEKPAVSLVKNWLHLFPEVPIINAYGPTETSDDVTHATLHTDDLTDGISIGKAIQNVRLYILDEQLGLQPQHLPGELYIAGACVGRGYLNDVEKTASKFIQDPFFPNDRMYKTGDIARLHRNGELEFVGRKDHQVKLRGQRIELLDIESHLLQMSGVKMAAVILRESPEPAICAFVSTITPDISVSTIKRFLRDHLPAYMLPTEIVILSDFPTTPNGKVDRPRLSVMQIAGQEKPSLPANEIEKKIAEIWTDILRNEISSVRDNFFDKGGHSLTAMRAMSRINEKFGTSLKIRDLFEHATVAELSQRIVDTTTASQEVKMIRTGDQPYYPVSHAQKRLWIENKMDTRQHAYNISSAVRVEGAVDMKILDATFRKIIERHEILRTGFVMIDGEIVQSIDSDASRFSFRYHDLVDSDHHETTLNEIISNASSFQFDLTNDGLIRVDVCKMEENVHVLVLVMHHIISDAWSMMLFTTEVHQIYELLSQQAQAVLAPVKWQYRDFVNWQNRVLDEGGIHTHHDFWMQKLKSDRQLLDLPLDFDRPPEKTSHGAIFQFSVDPSTAQHLRDLAASNGVSVFALLVTSLNALLYKYTGQSDIILGFTSAGRAHTDLESMLGYFINTIPLRTTFSPDTSFRELLKLTHREILDAMDHEMYPFDRIVNDLQLKRDGSRSPLFDILIEYQNFQNIETPSGGENILSFEPWDMEHTTSKFDLTFFFNDTPSGLEVLIEYNTDLLETNSIKRISKSLTDIWAASLNNPTWILEDYILPQDVGTSNVLVKPELMNGTVLEDIRRMMLARADSAAIKEFDQTLTYAELYQRAHQLAAQLLRKGIGQGHVVPIVMPISTSLVVSMLGTAFSGAAFLPINLLDPPARKKFIMNEVDPALVLIDSQALLEVQEYYNGDVIAVDLMENDLTTQPIPEHEQNPPPSSLAYIMYTSGSTGKPKGVRIGWTSFTNYVRWASQEYFNSIERNSFALFTNPAFDLTLTSIFCPLARGETIHIFQNPPHEFLPSLFDERANVTVVKMTPSHLNYLRNVRENKGRLRVVILGGEQVNEQHVTLLKDIDEAIEIYNEYGPTETTVGCSWEKLERHKPVTAGIAIPNTAIYFLDTKGNPVPTGVFGELCVAGVALGLGYVLPDLERGKFMNLHLNGTLQRVYRTGDRGRYLASGEIELRGRIDRQIKINGYRVEMEAIEQILLRCPGITNAAVIALPRGDQNELIAFYTSSGEIGTADLTSALEKQLPVYFRPQWLRQISAMPMTSNGKIDYKSLPDPRHLVATNESTIEEPRTEIEKTLSKIWCEVLGVERVGLQDDFFQLGGNSLRVIQVVQTFDPTAKDALRVTDFFNSAIFRDIATVVQDRIGLQVQADEKVEYDL